MTETELARRDILRQQRRAYVRETLKFRPRPEKQVKETSLSFIKRKGK